MKETLLFINQLIVEINDEFSNGYCILFWQIDSIKKGEEFIRIVTSMSINDHPDYEYIKFPISLLDEANPKEAVFEYLKKEKEEKLRLDAIKKEEKEKKLLEEKEAKELAEYNRLKEKYGN